MTTKYETHITKKDGTVTVVPETSKTGAADRARRNCHAGCPENLNAKVIEVATNTVLCEYQNLGGKVAACVKALKR